MIKFTYKGKALAYMPRIDATIEQIKARGIRMGSHAHLPKGERKVRVQTFTSKTRPTRFLKKQHGSSDEYLTQMSARKKKLNLEFLTALKEVGTA